METITNMASEILSSTIKKGKDVAGLEGNGKVQSLQANIKDVHDKDNRITSDWGVKQSNTDDWLKVTSDGQQGPMLLEDGFGREKVWWPPYSAISWLTYVPDSSLRS
jgi:catalase